MKTIVKPVIACRSAATMAILSFWGVALAVTPADLDKSKMVINRDLARISQQEQSVKLLKDKCKSEKHTWMCSCSSKSELLKAQADLDKSKAYLKADKVEMLREHEAFISERKDAISRERTELRASEKNLKGDLARGDAVSVMYTQDIVNRKHEIKQNEVALKQAIISRNNDLLAVNKKIKGENAESPVMLAFENSMAKTQNAVNK